MTKSAQASPRQTFVRFDLLQRIQHIVFLASFSLLGFTGLPQKFPLSPISGVIFTLVGGIENTRAIHHTSAIVMMIISLVHVLEVLYRILVLRTPISMIPWIDDLQHVIHDVMYYVGLRKHKGYYGRYSYAEKMEYLALIWGTIVMGLTGFMMWNPISTVRFLPGEAIPAAKAAHGGEAVLAVLAIVIWHFYHVHIKHLNKSMFTGTLTREEMEHEHPAELAALEAAKPAAPIPPAVLRRRQMVYFPIAAVILVAFSIGFYYFIGYETTSVTVAPPAETAPVFVPATPTPAPPTATPEAASAAASLTWNDAIGPMLQAKCAMCHGADSATGLSMNTYANFMKGGKNGPVVVPGDSDGSEIIAVQSAGGHPAQLSPEELNQLIEWIKAGASE
jgi:cytochrome b subunit of formate dehydrogenase/mono/diheme cytochrome c family protein